MRVEHADQGHGLAGADHGDGQGEVVAELGDAAGPRRAAVHDVLAHHVQYVLQSDIS